MDATYLGGRLPLLDPASLTDSQKAVYDRLRATMIRWADQSGFQGMTDQGRLIGPFNPVMLSPGIAPAFLDLQDAEQSNTTLSERVRQVVILAVGAVWRADYKLYAHAAVGRKAGLPDNVLLGLAAGTLPDDLSEQEKIAGRFARQLVAEHRVGCGTLSHRRGGIWRARPSGHHLPGRHLPTGLRSADCVRDPGSGGEPLEPIAAGSGRWFAQGDADDGRPVSGQVVSREPRRPPRQLRTRDLRHHERTVLRSTVVRNGHGGASPPALLRTGADRSDRDRAGHLPNLHGQPVHDP